MDTVASSAPTPEIGTKLLPIAGIELASVAAGIRKANRLDLTLITLAAGTQVAGLFTRNLYCAAPVELCRKFLAQAAPRALIINTGCANAGTGEQGRAAALQVCGQVAAIVGCAPNQVLPFSTGVIMEPLPTAPIIQALPACQNALTPAGWERAAQAIMTTDTVPKATSRTTTCQGRAVTCTGIAKGAGMIHPNMATMLSFVATDARIHPDALAPLWREAVENSFHCISVDGDTSTNDSALLLATGLAGGPELAPGDAGWDDLVATIGAVTKSLAQAIVRDGEGATKFVTVHIQGGRNSGECHQVAMAIARSPLVKTAFFASDPNLGRLLAAIGNSGVAGLSTKAIRLWLDGLLVVDAGERSPAYDEKAAAAIMKNKEFMIRVDLGRGRAQSEVWTCDLSHNYVTINAEYRS